MTISLRVAGHIPLSKNGQFFQLIIRNRHDMISLPRWHLRLTNYCKMLTLDDQSAVASSRVARRIVIEEEPRSPAGTEMALFPVEPVYGSPLASTV
jgi:putative exporter of polyketide antibiotics